MIRHVLPLLIVIPVFYLFFSVLGKLFPELGNRISQRAKRFSRIFPRPKMELSVKLCKRCKGFPCICKGKK